MCRNPVLAMHETTHLLRDLVALPSVNPMGRPLSGPDIFEARVTAYLEAFFKSLGVPWERQPVAPQRDNIVAVFDPPGATWALLLEAHQDTVPTDAMTIEPFAARVADGRLYGRGACDVKGGMAAMLGAFARVVRQRPPGSPRLMMACTVDEEHGFGGVSRLVRSPFITAPALPLSAVVAEPTNLRIVTAHKGAVRWDVVVTGRSCHSSSPELGVNAVYHMAALLPVIERYAGELRARPGHAALGPATLSVGRIEGGTSVNTVPDRCRVEVDRRLLPGEDADAALADFCGHLKRHAPGQVAFECSAPWLSAPALAADHSADLVERLGRAVAAVLGRPPEVIAVPYGTDAAPLAAAGMPAVVFGPGDIAKAHTADEWVPLDEVEQAADILFRLAVGA
jgi:acetylornithine deacetylase